MKFLSPSIHGYLDYLFAALILLAPTFFDFGGIAASLCYGFGVFQVSLSLATRYPMGVFPWMPFPIHGSVEMAGAILMCASPWIFNFAADSTPRNVFAIAGAALLGVWLVTDYRRLAIDAVAKHGRFTHPVAPAPLPKSRHPSRTGPETQDAA